MLYRGANVKVAGYSLGTGVPDASVVAAPPNVLASLVQGNAVANSTAGDALTLRVVPLDFYGNNVQTASSAYGLSFAYALTCFTLTSSTCPAVSAGSLTYSSADNSHVAQLTIAAAGSYGISVFMNGGSTLVSGKAYNVTVVSAPLTFFRDWPGCARKEQLRRAFCVSR